MTKAGFVETSNLRTLAILGGKPAFGEPLHVGRPNIGSRERVLELVGEILDRRWLTNNGPMVQEFERRVAELVGVRHCIAMCNATIGLEIAIRAADLGGEVIIPSYTFVATAHALQWQEITPVFCDIEEATHTLDPAKVEELITPRTTGIIGVHTWGRPCAIKALTEIAQRRNLVLMFDAAHAFACSHQGRLIGSNGLAEVFSFHATKFFNTFEGGAVVTNNDALAAKIRLIKNFGFSGFDNVIHIGTNGKMTEVCAAMGLANLDSLDVLVEANRNNYLAYRKHLKPIPGMRLIEYDQREKCNFQYIVVEVYSEQCLLTRDELVDVLHAENVLARKYFWPGVHQMQPYRSHFPKARLWLPVTEQVARRVLLLPTGQTMDEVHISRICDIIVRAIESSQDIRMKIAAAKR